MQDTLVRAYERRSSFRPGGNLRGWLLSILHNTFIDHRRRHVAEFRRLEQAAAGAETAAPPTRKAGCGSSPNLGTLRQGQGGLLADRPCRLRTDWDRRRQSTGAGSPAAVAPASVNLRRKHP
ncbi:sigma factor [Microvirga ossetica]|uniref:sigma factor n=1 Tax=Microvirga ossetica TaxID=1882682 RepID=UPI0030028D3B